MCPLYVQCAIPIPTVHTHKHTHTYHDNGERFDKAVKKALVFRSIYGDIGCAKEYACMSLLVFQIYGYIYLLYVQEVVTHFIK